MPNILSTAEYELSAAETIVLHQRAALPAQTHGTLFPVPTIDTPTRLRFGIWRTIYRKSLVALLTMLLSIAVVWTYFSFTPDIPALAALKGGAKQELARKVSQPPIEAAKLVVAAKEEVPVKSLGFDIDRHASETQIDTTNHSITYARAGRLEPADKFGLEMQQKSEQAKELRLRSISGSDSRYSASQGRLEWQGGFKSSDPAANAQRGQKYLEYLKENGVKNSEDALRTFGSKGSNASRSLQLEPKLNDSIKSYAK